MANYADNTPIAIGDYAIGPNQTLPFVLPGLVVDINPAGLVRMFCMKPKTALLDPNNLLGSLAIYEVICNPAQLNKIVPATAHVAFVSAATAPAATA